MALWKPDRYSTVAILLHWLIAGAIVFQVILAWRMHGRHDPQGFALVQLHKSIGITILLASLARLGWRLANPPPPEPPGLATWELWLARLTHFAFYVIMIGMPITGWIMVSTSRIAVPTLLYGAIPWPHVPGLAELAGPAKKAWNGFAHESHELGGWAIYGLVALHVAGALKHQLFSRDEPILARMAPGAKPGRWLEPRLFVILAGVAAVFAAGVLIQPPAPHSAPLPPPPAAVEDTAPAAPAAPAEPATPADAASTAAAPAEAATPATSADPVHWAVSPGSSLSFATAWSGQAVEGRFDKWTADILFSPEALDRSKVSVSIDLTSVATGDAQRDDSLHSADWFDTGAHAKATFTADRFDKAGPDRYVAHGKLTLRGVTKPMDLPFRLKIDGDKARMSGVTSLDRTAFGVGQGEWQATDQIPAQVKVSVSVNAKAR
jgi:cytochrome b561/polyisoprenoid-binding protein YceI